MGMPPPSRGTDQRHGVNFDHQGGSALGGWTRCNETGAHTDRARHAAKRAERRRPQPGCGVPPIGADGLTRCSSSLSPVQRMGPPPIHWQQTAAGLNRMARPAGRSPPRGAACGFWSRAWGRREPAAEATGRLQRPAQGRAREGGLDIPGRWRPMQLTSRRAPDSDVDAPPLVWHWLGDRSSPSDHHRCLLTQWATRGSSAARTGPWPQRRPHSG
jgi:hypothetical protein